LVSRLGGIIYIWSYLCISILNFHGLNKYLNPVANVSLNMIESLSLIFFFFEGRYFNGLVMFLPPNFTSVVFPVCGVKNDK